MAPRRVAALLLCASLVSGCAPMLGPAGVTEIETPAEPTPKELAAASVAGYLAGGLPPLLLAIVGASYGWLVPVAATFAIGGAAYSLVAPSESPRADEVPAALKATAGAVRGVVFFPAMMAFAGRKVYAPLWARALHDWRRGR